MTEASFLVESVVGIPVVTAPEELDITNASMLRAAVLEAAADGRGKFVVDMSGTQYCDSAGLHVLVRAHKQAESNGGAMLVVISTETVRRVLAVTGIDGLLEHVGTLDDALTQARAYLPGRNGQRP
jgi:anti-sigma B factor antagonist